jgi:hypothetical protein
MRIALMALSFTVLASAKHVQKAIPLASEERVAQAGVGGTGVVYTCDPSVNAVAGLCNALNTTIAGIYSSAFSNANASIYITFGSAGGASSDDYNFSLSYAGFRSALQSSLAGPADSLAFSSSVPGTNPINPSYPIFAKAPLLRALGFSATSGINTLGQLCSAGTSGCYDGILTLSAASQTAGLWYYRTGIISANQTDAFSAIQHETDEILGLGSCLGDCTLNGISYIAPADLYRYQSNGARSYAPGGNSPCSNGNTGNACFSLDGVNYLQQFNNLNNGQDYGDWAHNCNKPLVQDAQGCADVSGANIAPTAEIEELDVIGFTLATPTYYLSDLVFGGGFQTTLTYINYSTQPVTCATTFYSDAGTPLTIPFSAQTVVGVRRDTIPPGVTIHDQTNALVAPPVAVEGWAQASCTAPVSISLLYRLSNAGTPVGEASVNAETAPTTEFATFAQANSAGSTGIAFGNPSGTQSATITFTAYNSAGSALGSQSVTLGPLQHSAANIGPLLGLTNFTGSVQITSNIPIISLSLNAEAFPVFSSLPPGDLPGGTPLTGSGNSGTTTPQTYYFSDLAFSGGFQTTLTYVNYSPEPVTCTTAFFSDSGTALSVPFNSGTSFIRTDTLQPGQSIHDQTVANLQAAVVEGWAQAVCSGPIEAGLLYRLYSATAGGNTASGEASVNAETSATTEFVTFAQSAASSTGIAFANPSTTQSATITVSGYNSIAEKLGTQSITLGPLQHAGVNIGPLLGLFNFTGFVKITSSSPIISLSLNAEAFPVFSSLPPGDLPAGTSIVP